MNLPLPSRTLGQEYQRVSKLVYIDQSNVPAKFGALTESLGKVVGAVGNAQMSDTWQKCPLSPMTDFMTNNNAVNESSLSRH